jgi:hypothetical protein
LTTVARRTTREQLAAVLVLLTLIQRQLTTLAVGAAELDDLLAIAIVVANLVDHRRLDVGSATVPGLTTRQQLAALVVLAALVEGQVTALAVFEAEFDDLLTVAEGVADLAHRRLVAGLIGAVSGPWTRFPVLEDYPLPVRVTHDAQIPTLRPVVVAGHRLGTHGRITLEGLVITGNATIVRRSAGEHLTTALVLLTLLK